MIDDFCKEKVLYNDKLFTCGVTLGEGEAICIFCKNKKLESENQTLREIVEMLKKSNAFYAHIGNWNGGTHANRCHPTDMEDIKDSCCKIHVGKFGGRLARSTQKQVEILEKKLEKQ